MTRRRTLWTSLIVAVLVLACLRFLLQKNPEGPKPSAVPAALTKAGLIHQADSVDGSISGCVRNGVGDAVARARVCATTVSSDVFGIPNMTCVVAASTGDYRITGLASTEYVVSAAADGFQPGSALHGGGVLLGQGEAKTGIDIVLDEGGANLSGQVLDATGGPISGATLVVVRQGTPRDTAVATSRPDGRFALWIAAGPVTVLARAHGYSFARIAHIAPSAGLVVTLTPGSTIRGRVVAEGTGTPVPGVEVRAVVAGSLNTSLASAETSDANGTFEIQGLEPGSYTLSGEGEGWRGDMLTPIQIGLASQIQGVTLTVSAAARVTGKVLKRNKDEPCSRGSVSLGPEASAIPAPGLVGAAFPRLRVMFASIESDGTVRFKAVPIGGYHVEVECLDHNLVDGPTTLAVRHSDVEGIVWKVAAAVRLVVHAVDDAGEPAANAHLRLYGPGPKDGDRATELSRASFVTDATGTYEVRGLSPGLYDLKPDRGFEGEAVQIDARASEKVEATIRLAGRGAILVTVKTPDGQGVDQVSVSASPAAESGAPSTDSIAPGGATQPARPASGLSPLGGSPAAALGNGRFKIGPLAAGPYRVQVSDGINPSVAPSDWSQGIVRVSAGIVQATVILRRGGNISGRVVDSSGQALPDTLVGANCVTRSADDGASGLLSRLGPLGPLPPSRVVSDPEGLFRIDGLENGVTCTVRAEVPGGSVGVAKGAHPGDDIVVMVPALGTLSGTAALVDGSPLSNFTLSVRDPVTGVKRRETVTVVDGRWSLTRVVPGQLQLLAFEPAGSLAEAGCELSPGQVRDGIQLQFRTPVQDVPMGSPTRSQ